MIDTAQLLTDFESCSRKGFWTQSWEKEKLSPARMLEKGILGGLTFDGKDFEEAGAIVYELGATRGVDSSEYDTHSQVVHIAAMADVIVTAIRKKNDPPWKYIDPIDGWIPNCFISPDGKYLRRVVLSSSWSDDKSNSIFRSWHTLGPLAYYDIPMQIVVVITGTHRNGRYHSFWTHGLQHPQNKKLRFRKKTDIGTGFKSSWLESWREDHDEITSDMWLDGMLEDNVLRDLLFRIDYPRLEERSRRRIIEIYEKKLDVIRGIKATPDEQFSGCAWPLPCQFLKVCSNGESPSGRYGFIPVNNIT